MITMKKPSCKNIALGKLCLFASISILLSLGQGIQAQTMADYTALPPTAVDSTSPLVMLVMSRDNQLWHKAYNDYSDLDGDGTLDTTYNDNFEYYGYFHSDYCYSYNTTTNLFSPTAQVTTGTHQCSNAWSGNFMNWLTTTRIDVVRKVLYGGYRSTDTTSSTILQRAFIPSDNHAFVKIVSNSTLPIGSITDYTPITGQTELSFCNVTDYVSGSSDRSGDMSDVTNPPKLKIASGVEFTWSGSERDQCQYTNEGGNGDYSPSRPLVGSIAGSNLPSDYELVVRVEVCVSGLDENDEEVCRDYEAADGTVTTKPFGLLQTYGETGNFKFGLMSGSWENNTDGGVLRKNVSFMGGANADPEDIEIDSETGRFINQATTDDGIINTLNRFRIVGWDYSSEVYHDCSNPGISQNDFLNSTASNRQCRDWGNPISEIYIEALRYLAGETVASSDFAANDSALIPGLDPVTWEDPYTEDTLCSQCNIVVLSTGLNNFDGDQLGAATDLPNVNVTGGIQSFTDDVGDAEGLGTGTYIVGVGSGTVLGSNEECDAKTIANFGSIRGICPETPSLDGTFNIAGGAYYASQNDFRTDLEGEQLAQTYTVSLAEPLPSFEITTSTGDTVTFVPTCRSNGSGSATVTSSGWIECSLVDLTVIDTSLFPDYGRLVISWEDSSWGNDYDMDAYAIVEYCTATGSALAVRAACPNYTTNEAVVAPRPDWSSANDGDIQLRTSMVAASAGFAIKFGYTVTGADGSYGNADGPYVDELLRPGGYNGVSDVLGGGLSNWILWSSSARRFRAAPTTPDLLNNPLWYAAKYGNFTDSNGNNIPDLDSEWDTQNERGVAGADGVPDAYFQVRNPAFLRQALATAFGDISQRVSAGSAAAVNAQTGRGEGAIYQALYVPSLEGTNESISWFGSLHGLFVDRQGRLRDDANGDGVLSNDTSVDYILGIEFDEVDDETYIQRFTYNSGTNTNDPVGSRFTFSDSDFSPIWSAREQMNAISDFTSNRATYTSTANNGRMIYTAIDRDGDGLIVDPDVLDANPGQSATNDGIYPFTASNFSTTGATANDANYLGFGATATDTEVGNLINFIRGQEGISGFRSRTLNGEAYLIGDIIHSTPAVVGRPSENYHILYRDDTYQAYIDAYDDRRNVVYVGANDGMLHAFNSGYFDTNNIGFSETGTGSAHPLGSELWAYVPFNLLPHLQWLASPAYSHVYYLDGPVQAFDVNIFTPSATHPEGWGTIIVAGMRFGGGDYSFDHDADPLTPDITTRSAYVIFDVTDPEQPPQLIAEITDAELGYSASVPEIVKYRKPNSTSGSYSGTSQNAWYLVFGSGPRGPDAIDQALSDAPPHVFVFDLISRSLTRTQLEVGSGVPEVDSFTGGFEAADWDRDYDDDAVYFGLVAGTVAAPEGKLKRGELTFNSAGVLTTDFSVDLYNDHNRAFSAQPLTYLDTRGDPWVFAGTGRLFVPEDNLSEQQQSYFGLKDEDLDITIDQTDLVETTNVAVFEDGRIFNDSGAALSLTAGGTTAALEQFDELVAFVADNSGWFFEFETLDEFLTSPTAEDPYIFDTGNPRIRNTTKAALAGENLVITAYESTNQFCLPEGDGLLMTPAVYTGTPAPFAPSGTFDTVFIGAADPSDPSVPRVKEGIQLPPGIPSQPVVTRPTESAPDEECDSYVAWVQSSTGVLGGTDIGCESEPVGRQSWREIPVNW